MEACLHGLVYPNQRREGTVQRGEIFLSHERGWKVVMREVVEA